MFETIKSIASKVFRQIHTLETWQSPAGAGSYETNVGARPSGRLSNFVSLKIAGRDD
jgi:hypothetical protein